MPKKITDRVRCPECDGDKQYRCYHCETLVLCKRCKGAGMVARGSLSGREAFQSKRRAS